jgi:hypothetical protein
MPRVVSYGMKPTGWVRGLGDCFWFFWYNQKMSNDSNLTPWYTLVPLWKRIILIILILILSLPILYAIAVFFGWLMGGSPLCGFLCLW